MASLFDLQKAASEILSFQSFRQETPRSLINYMMDLLDHANFRILEQAASFSDEDYTNLIGMMGPTGAGGLLLCSAIPMPPLTNEILWTETEEDPFNPTVRDGLLFGHAATTGRIDWVCKLLAATSIDPTTLRRPLTLAALFGSQSRVAGPMHLLDSGLCQPEWAIVSEPTNLELVSSHRGYLLFQLKFQALTTPDPLQEARHIWRIESRGVSTHSAFPSLGRNAINLAFDTVERWRSTGHKFSIHDLSSPHQMSKVPDQCRFHITTDEHDWIPSAPHLAVELLPPSTTVGPALDTAFSAWRRIHPQIHELFRWTTPESAVHFMPPRPVYSILGVSCSPEGAMTLSIDCRPLPGQNAETILRDIDAIARRSVGDTFSTETDLIQNHLPHTGEPLGSLTSIASQCLSEVGVPPVVGTYNGCTEAWILSAAQVETLAFGPGLPFQGKYQPNEYTVVQHLYKATSFYERLIRRLCCH